jgi:hypothetical protein
MIIFSQRVFFVLAAIINIHMMGMGPWVALLAGDTCLGAAGLAIYTKNRLGWEKGYGAKLIGQGLQPSQIARIKGDGDKAYPYIPVLIPAGVALSVGSRIALVYACKTYIGGAALFTASIPMGIALVGASYGLRILLAPDNAGVGWKFLDWATK